MKAGLVAILVASLLAMATPALAAQGTLRGHADYPFEVTGTHEVAASNADFTLAGPTGAVSFLLQGAEGKATRVVERSFPIVDNRDPEAKVLWQQRTERIPIDLKGATLSLKTVDREQDFQLLAYDGPAVLGSRASQPSTLTIATVTAPLPVQSPQPSADVAQVILGATEPFTHTIDHGLSVAHSMAGTLTMDGTVKLFVSGARLDLVSGDGSQSRIAAYTREEQQDGRVYDPIGQSWVGGGSHTEHVTEYLLLEADVGHLAVQFSGQPGRMYSSHPTITVDGTARLPNMTGTVTVTDKDTTTTHELDGQDLTVAGRFRFTPVAGDADGKGTTIEGTGDYTTVAYGAVDARYDWASAIAAVGLGAAVLAGIGWVVANGKTLLGLGGGGLLAGYARVHGDEILEHPGRAEVYERVKAFPGVNFVQLSEQVDFGTSTLNYHLRVLEKNGFVTSVRDGRYLRFFDRKSGHYSNQKKFQVSALRNPQTAAIAQHIRANPGVAQCDLATTFGVTASTITWHINRLLQQGLVTKSRDAHRTRYFVGEAWANLPADEQVRQDAAMTPAPQPAVAVAAVA